MRAPWLVRTSSLCFHNARALRHTSALLRHNARSLHRYERAQLTIHFIKEIKQKKNLFLEQFEHYMNTWEFLRTLDKCEKHFSRVLKDSCVHI